MNNFFRINSCLTFKMWFIFMAVLSSAQSIQITESSAIGHKTSVNGSIVLQYTTRSKLQCADRLATKLYILKKNNL